MIKRVLSFLSAVAVFCSCMTVTVRAAESNASGWIELLEVVSIQDNGENIFRMGQTYTLAIPMPKEMRVRKIDMLIRSPAPHPITAASCTVNTTTTELTVLQIGDNLIRIVGTLPDATYETIKIKLSRSGTSSQPYEVLSCKVSPITTQEFVCEATVFFQNETYPVPGHIEYDGLATYHDVLDDQIRIDISDWNKYDSLTVWGSADGFSISSIRATLSTSGLPITVNYIDSTESGGHFTFDQGGYLTEYEYSADSYLGYGYGEIACPYSKYLFCVSIDLTGVDRTYDSPLYVYLTGQFDDMFGYTFNCQYVNGQIVTADTSNVTWWQKFTSFMTGLFGGESSDAEDFRDDAAQKGEEMDDLNNQLQEVTKPPVDEVQTDLDGYISPDDAGVVTDTMLALTGDSLITSMLMITLTIALVAYILFGKR